MKKILLLAAIAIGIAGPAHAGPVAAAVAWVGSTMAAGGVAGALLRIAVGIGSQLLAGVLGKAMAEKPKVSVQFDVEFGDDTPLAFVVGDYATAGKRKYLGSWGKNSRYITEVIEVSCLPQPGLAAMWVNDEAGRVLWGETDSDGTGHNLGHPVTNLDDDGHRIWVRWVNGMQTAADPMLVALFGGDPDYPWTSDMIGTGKSYVIVTTRYDSDTLTSYPTYLWQPEPLPMYDPRKDGSTGGTGSHRWGNRSTYEPTRNAAVIAYNVGRGIYYGSEWIFGGKNLPAWRLPRAEWVAAMTACDRAIALAGGGSEPAFRAGLEIRADVTAADVLEELGRAANMRFAEVGGMLKPIVGIPGAAVFAFTDGDILISEGQSYKPFDSLSATYNALSATYPEPAEKWSTKDAPEYVDAAFTAADGGRYLPTSIAYPAAPFRNQVQRLMRAQMRDYRRFRTHQFYLPPDAYGLEPLVDVVSWTSERNGYVNKLFVVESVSKTPGMKVAVSLREVDPSDYDWSSDFELPTSIVTPAPVRPWVQAVAGFGAEAVIVTDNATKARSVAIRATCGGDEVGVTHIRLQVRKSSEADASIDVQRPYGAPYAWLIHSVNQRTTYQVRGLLMLELTPKGAWSGWITVTTGSVYVDDSDFVGGVTGLFQGAGMKPTRDIPNRSTPGDYVDELAWSRADKGLYKWNGTAWVHFIQESVNGILDETAFAANIRIPKTVTALPTSGQRFGDLVLLTTDRQQYLWDGTKWTAEVMADQIVGKLTAMQIGANAIGAEQVAARALSARHLVVSDFTNLVPDDQLQDRLSWAITNPNAAEFRDSGELAIKPQSLGYIRFSGGLSGGTFSRAHSGEFPVEGNEEFFCQGEAWRQSGSAPNSGITFHVQFRDGDGNWMVPDQRFYYRYLTAEGLQSGAQVQSGSVVAPANARSARIYISMLAGTDGTWIAASPLVRRKFGGQLVIDGDLEARHIKFGTLTGGLMASTGIITLSAQIGNLVVTNAHLANATIQGAKIANLTVDTLNIKDGAVTQVRNIANWTGVGTDNTSTWVDVVTLNWNSAKAGVHLQTVNLRRKASAGGARLVYYRVLLDGAVVTLGSGEDGGLTNPGPASDGPIKEFVYIKSLNAGSHTMKIQMLTSGFSGTLGGEITDLEWYK
ncbi:phage tail protein [Paracoccus sp. (in: a-proteobacteria)]|uniref:phage tail protein n=1 Tax=Paracoccus sp. TaxID=267 RepID=UPI00289D6DA6|nr:phage tail protein [Paracoccus sp. (in: a-proteobacteria)]